MGRMRWRRGVVRGGPRREYSSRTRRGVPIDTDAIVSSRPTRAARLRRAVIPEEDTLDARLDGLVVQDGEEDGGAYVSEAQETREERAKNDDPLDLVRVREEVGVRADVQAVLVAVGLVLAAAAKGRGRVLVARRARDRDRAATARRRRSRCRDANGNASGRGGDARGARDAAGGARWRRRRRADDGARGRGDQHRVARGGAPRLVRARRPDEGVAEVM